MMNYIKDGAAIYRESFSIIRREADLSAFPLDLARVVVRMIHACGMTDLPQLVLASQGAAEVGMQALLAGAPILCDASMVANGITRSRLPRNNEVICTLRDAATAELAAKLQTTRSAAALELWRIAPGDPRAKGWAKAQWKDGALVMPGLAPLALPALAATAHARNLVTGALTHSFSRWAWSRARFVLGAEQYRAEIDALAVRKGGGKFDRLDRVSVKFPPTHNNQSGNVYTSMCGTLVRVEIERASGALRIAKAYSVLECGQALVPEIVLGQAQGGFAMGVGYALLETLPLYEDGPGNGKWNLGQYLVARGSDLPLSGLEVEVLPPAELDEKPKGIAEVVMIPVVPALLNAIFDATGHRFQSLPVTQAILKRALE